MWVGKGMGREVLGFYLYDCLHCPAGKPEEYPITENILKEGEIISGKL